jgi:hypothetical protein
VQNAINAATNGGTVQVPGGSASWSSTISTGKQITINFGGCTIAQNISGSQIHLIHFLQGTSFSTRVTNGTFTGGTYDRRMFSFSGTPSAKPFRLDHSTFSGTGNLIFVDVNGMAPGLIDHNTFNGGDAAEMIHNLANDSDTSDTSYDIPGWNDDVNVGSQDAVYVEDNTFTKNDCGSPCYFYGTSALQAYYGARTVMRFNTNNMVQFDQHGTTGAVGARWWEIYENTYNLNGNNPNWDPLNDLRAGSGVNFHNHRSGPANQGNEEIDLREEDAGHPALYQIGRGKFGILQPAYVWGDSSSIGVNSHSSNVVPNQDYYCGTMGAGNGCVSPTSFNGTSGVGEGLIASRPVTCTVNVAYWATDQGSWNTKLAPNTSGQLYKCIATNTWTLFYVPYTYPHPLDK